MADSNLFRALRKFHPILFHVFASLLTDVFLLAHIEETA